MGSDQVQEIKDGRRDLSDYLVHFTRNPTPFSNLKSIVSDGMLKCGWSVVSIKSGRTVYGAKPAVCFSESPLWAMLDYAEKRKDKLAPYGLFISKEQFYKAGGRPVIYGTSTEPVKAQPDKQGCVMIQNLPAEEQYRYILTAINDTNDWTHEREWRWANICGRTECDDFLPLWRIGQIHPMPNAHFSYAKIGIILNSMAEAGEILSILKQQYTDEYAKTQARPEHLDAREYWTSGDYGEFHLGVIDSLKIIVLSRYTKRQLTRLTIEGALKDRGTISVKQYLHKVCGIPTS